LEVRSSATLLCVVCYAEVACTGSDFDKTLVDIAKPLGSPVNISFITKHTGPDFTRIYLNGTMEKIVDAGKASYKRFGPGIMAKSNKTDSGGYTVTYCISELTENDAGTYNASANNAIVNSQKSYMELIVYGKKIYIIIYFDCTTLCTKIYAVE